LGNVCPNSGGGFERRPIRPAAEWRPGVSAAKQPPFSKRIRMARDLAEVKAFPARLKDVPPEKR